MRSYIHHLAVAGFLVSTLSGAAQNIRREYWLNITGNPVSALTSSPDFPHNPSGVDFPTMFEGPTQWNENYGSRLRGYVHPPVTGDYIFWIASDDGGALYLSLDEYPATKELVATVNTWTSSREWTKEANQKSAPIRLEAGRKYYIEALQKEGGGGDNVAVAWQLPDGKFEGPIPGTRLSPFLLSTNPPAIVTHPTNRVAPEGTRAEFRVVVTGAEPLTFRWQENGADLPAQVFATLVINPTTLADDGRVFRCVISNPLGSVTSSVASLSVTPEIVPPVLISRAPAAGGTVRNLNQVELFFSEPVFNVDASDLRVNGVSATQVVGSGSGPYVFSFPSVTTGTAAFTWSPGHGITDGSLAVNPFAGEGWQVTVNPAASFPDVIINEVLAANLTGLTDEDGEISDWIELYNRGTAAARVDGWSLTDDAGMPGQWVLPDVTIPAGGYLVIFTSGKDRRLVGSQLHTNFKLSRVGEYLGLFNAEYPRRVIDALAPSFPGQRGDHSYGRNAHFDWNYFATPTPGASNGDSPIERITESPHFSARRGFYDQPFRLHLSAEPGATIRYTLDGSEPVADTGMTYTGPIAITNTATVRAAAFAVNELPSSVVTHTYLVDTTPAIRSLPVLSLVSDTNHLWGPTGILESNPRNTVHRGIAWERPVSVELIRPEDNEGFAVPAGLRVQGGGYVRERYDPAGPLPFSKYSFRLYFRGDYGQRRLEYPLFPGVPFEEFERIVLRAGMNDHSNPFIVDELVRRLFADTGNVSSRGTLVNLYLNGEYKGYYNPTERIDADFLRSWHGGTNDWDLIAQFGEIQEGDPAKWNEMLGFITGNDLSSPSAYAHAGTLLDLDNFIDYLIVNVYAAMGDWPHNNWRAARPRIAGGKFQFLVWDAEWAMGNIGRGVNVNNLTGELAGASEIARLFQSLLASPEFRMRFADRVHRLMFNGGPLVDARIAACYRELRDELAGVLPNMDNYLPNTFIPGRRNVVFSQLAAFELFASGHAPVFNQHGGRVPDGFNLSMTAPRGTIFFTLDGSDPRAPAIANTQEFQLLSRPAAKMVLVPSPVNGGDLLGNGWKGGSEPFDDSAWTAGSGGVGYDLDATYDTHIQIDTEVEMLGINGTAFIRVPFDTTGVNLAELNQLSLRVQYDDGFVAWLNGVAIRSANAPGSPGWNSTATAGNADSSAVSFQSFNVSSHLGLLRPGANLLAIHALNVATNSSDFLCNVELVGRKVPPGQVSPGALTYTAPLPINQPVTVKARSLDNGEWSALTEATFQPNLLGLPLRITELMYNPVGGDAYEFIELHNYGFAPVDVGSFSFSGITYLFPPDALVPGGGTIVLASDANPVLFAARYPGVNVVGHFAGSLSNSGERIALLDRNGNVVTSVTYDDGGTWATSADGGGSSLTLHDPLTDAGQSAAWRAGNQGGTPGVPPGATSPPSLRLNELMADNTNAVPHEGVFADWVELHNTGTTPVNLANWSLSDDSDPRKFVFPPGTTMPAGGYLVVWCDASSTSGLHSGFALDRDGESVVLFDANTNLVDAVSFGAQPATHSLGRLDGSAISWRLNQPTPGAANQPAALAPASALVLNEWLANPPPGEPDWFELHNSDASLPASLQGLHLGNGATLHVLRGHSFLPPGGFLRLFADEEAGVDHVEFKLPAAGGALSLYDSAGALIQTVTFGAQTEGVSQGRLPDASVNVQSFPGSASPGASNFTAAWTGPVINEFMALNNGGVTMAGGRAADWFELRNPGAAPFDLTGMSVSIGKAQPGEWTFPAGLNLPAGGHLVIWCSDALPPTSGMAAELNTGKALNGSGDGIHLFNAPGQRVDGIEFGPQLRDVAVGRDGSTWRLLNSPTPGSFNAAFATMSPVTGVLINEWQSNPGEGNDWLELYNTNASPVALEGAYITDDPSLAGKTRHRFRTASFIGPRGWLRLVADGDPGDGGDHLDFSLAATGEHLRLYTAGLSPVDAIDFGAQPPAASTGRFPDGAEHLITFTTTVSPGDSNYLPLENVVVNEVLAHTDPPLTDAIEFHNPTGVPVNIGGWFLSDDAANFRKYQVPAGTVIPAAGHRVFTESHFNGGTGSSVPFTLDSARGDTIYLSQPDTFGNLTGFRAQASFGATFNGMSLGRVPTSLGHDFAPLTAPTLGASNATPLIPPVVINEILAEPPALPGLDADDSEYVELFNRTSATVALHDPVLPTNTWRLAGAVEYSFPAWATLAGGSRALVVGFDPVTSNAKLAAFRAAYEVPTEVAVFGPFNGRLSGAGETLRLLMPDRPQTSGPEPGLVPYPEIERVAWSGAHPWPAAGLGAGAALQRLTATSFANDPVNWTTDAPTAGNYNSGSPLDSDFDGMADWWERTHGLNPLSSADAELDSDGDGIVNREEFRARTEPFDAASRLAIDEVLHTPGSATIRFRTSAGVAYEVQRRDSLGADAWQAWQTVPKSYAPSEAQAVDSQTSGPQRFYRLRVK